MFSLASKLTPRLSLLAVGVLSAITVAALVGRHQAQLAEQRAERERQQAEALVEFMLGDLRDKLQPLNRLDLLELAGKRTLDYFRAPGRQDGAADDLGRRARTLHILGEIESRRGDLPKAKALFAEARQITARAYAATPRDPARLFEHAESMFWIGYLDWREGRQAEAETAFVEHARLSAALVTLEPKNPKWLKESATASLNLGALRYQRGAYPAALPAFESASRAWSALVAVSPADRDVQLSLAQVASWLADTRRALGAFEAALAEREKESRIYAALLEREPDLEAARQMLPVVELAKGRLLLELGKSDAALARFGAAADEAARLAATEAADAGTRELEIRAWTELAETQTIVKDCKAAEQSATRALRALSASLSPETPFLAVLGGRVLTAKARCRLLAADSAGALAASTAALDAIGPIADAAADAESRFIGVEAWLVKGDAQAKARQTDLAIASWSRALELSGRGAAPLRPYQRLLRATLLSRVGREAEARSILAELQALGYLHPYMAGLTGLGDAAASATDDGSTRR
ncbi:MAG: hypothetical protein KJS95_08975 [Gammaproteobacteria bacterium]|nr:hypothetical protein [Gammaproteobacteria bacterium]